SPTSLFLLNPSPEGAGLSHLVGNGADSLCSPPPRAAALPLRARGGVGGGGAFFSFFVASMPPPLAPPHSHPATLASRGPRLGEGNTPSLRRASRHIR